ncbi:MAG TPA: protocatechuate 3,4-dioxygenase subunit beta [Actinomycetota bacterium]
MAEEPRADDPPYLFPEYVATRLRAPNRLLLLPPRLLDRGGPVFGSDVVDPGESDLTTGRAGEPIGERIIMTGRVSDREGRPVRNALIEIWQANAAGRYVHHVDRHPAPLDPNFTGAGRCLTDDEGRYRFVSVKPGPYPWRNHDKAWRPSHIHFSLFGRSFVDRLITQMYFPGDPLFGQDPIFNSVRDPKARERMVSAFDLDTTVAEWTVGYRFDVVLGGPAATPLEGPR